MHEASLCGHTGLQKHSLLQTHPCFCFFLADRPLRHLPEAGEKYVPTPSERKEQELPAIGTMSGSFKSMNLCTCLKII